MPEEWIALYRNHANEIDAVVRALQQQGGKCKQDTVIEWLSSRYDRYDSQSRNGAMNDQMRPFTPPDFIASHNNDTKLTSSGIQRGRGWHFWE